MAREIALTLVILAIALESLSVHAKSIGNPKDCPVYNDPGPHCEVNGEETDENGCVHPIISCLIPACIHRHKNPDAAGCIWAETGTDANGCPEYTRLCPSQE